jgi:SAM-dependent methyltransferase
MTPGTPSLQPRRWLISAVSAREYGSCTPVRSTGLEPASFDVVFIRNLLVHNGPATGAILSHARRLLRPGGHLLCAEPDITGLRFPRQAAAEQELEQRWIQMTRSMGNDPGLGAEGQLAALISAAGFIPDRAVHRVDPLDVERSPAWTARQMMLDTGFATNADITRWDTAITARLRDAGLLTCRLPVTAVVAHPAPARHPARKPNEPQSPIGSRNPRHPRRSRTANRHPQYVDRVPTPVAGTRLVSALSPRRGVRGRCG